MNGILSAIRVVDLSTGRAGSIAALLLAESGADVVKVEARGGHPERGIDRRKAIFCGDRAGRGS